MRGVFILLSAVILGLVGGYGWSMATAPAAEASAPRKAGMMALPASPEEQPGTSDRDWAERANGGGPLLIDQAPDPTQDRTAVEQSVYYSGCNEVRAAGRAPLYSGQPGYRGEMDGDGDGIACEPYRRA